MKKILLVVCCFIFSFGFSQINSQVSPLIVCDTDNDGVATFNLSIKIPEILVNLNPTVNNVSFHVSLSDSQSGLNPIVNISNFTNLIPFTQIIFVRVTNSQTNANSFTSFVLSVNSPPNAGIDGQIIVCETSSNILNLYSIISGEQPGGIWDRITGTGGVFNAVSGIYSPAIGATSSTFTYTVLGTMPCANDNNIATINILSSNNCNTEMCQVPVNLSASNSGFNGASLTWSETGNATSWEILVLPCGSAIPTPTATDFFVATTNPFQITGLNPETCYSFYVRSVCTSQNKSAWSSSINYDTPPNPPNCGGVFLDNGGSNSNYLSNTDSTVTICPTMPGFLVTATFSEFNTEVGSDALYIYNGNSIASPLIPSANPTGNVPGGVAGGFWGATIPGPFTSSAPSGCLTFRFRSDATNNLSGWIANITCLSPDECPSLINLNVTNVTSTSAVLNWLNFTSSNNSEIVIVPFGSAPPNETNVGVTIQINPYVITGLAPNTCYSAYVRSSCSLSSTNFTAWSQPASFCAVDCTNTGQCLSGLSLIAFLDSNNNGIKDTNEAVFNNGTFLYTINNENTQYYGNTNSGNYSIFNNNPANIYNLSFLLNANLALYYSSSATYSNVTIALNSGITNYYFPITTLQTYNDLQVQIIPNNNPNPGFSYYNTINYKNNSIQTISSGTVTFTKDNNLTITSLTQSGITTSPNGFSYNFTNLLPFEERSIFVQMQVPTIPTIMLGTIVTNSATITPITNDAFPNNNSTTLAQTVVGSYDPNDKTESHGGKIVFSNFTSNDFLTYTIRFENTGTANTQFVRIEDFLHSSLNINSVEVLNASHPFNFRRENNKLIWNFYNISLTPSSINNDASQGYVRFRVKPNVGYSVGTVIPNSAEIYFDYNPPIYTDIFNTEFVQNLKNSIFTNEDFILYPNPASDFVQVTLQNQFDKIKDIIIYDVVGKVIKIVSNINSFEAQILTSEFSKGLYIIEINTSENLKQVKKLIVK